MGLRNCTIDKSHQIPGHLRACPYCEAQIHRAKARPVAAKPATAPMRTHAPTPAKSGMSAGATAARRSVATRRAMIAAGGMGAVVLAVAAIQLGTRGETSESAPQPAGATPNSSEVTQAQPGITTSEGMAPPEEPAVTSTPDLRVPADGAWIVVLESKPKTDNDSASVLKLATEFGNSGPSVEVIDSDVTPGLNSGYWVVIHGDFATRAEAVQTCSKFGREVGGECYPRLIG